MKQYEYEAKIVRIDEGNKVMDVIYTSPGRQEILCGVRLPETEDDLGQTIHDAVPFGVWREAERSVFVPQVGTLVQGVVKFGQDVLVHEESVSIPFAEPVQQTSSGGYRSEGIAQSIGGSGGFPTRYTGDQQAASRAQSEIDPEVSL